MRVLSAAGKLRHFERPAQVDIQTAFFRLAVE